MDIKILEMGETKCRFILKDATPAKANALRRTMLTDIPKMAIDSVDFHLGPIDVDGREFESITPLFDEIIAHRLGMVPVPTRPDGFEFNYKSECSCGGEGCPSCTIVYSLQKTGPCTVYSSDLQPLAGPDSDKLRIVDEFIPIVELTADQGITVYAKAVMGTAKKHVKWQVCNGVGYKYMPKIEIDPKHASDEQVVACAKLCPAGLEVKSKKLVVKDPVACGYAKGCLEALDEVPGVKVDWDDQNFLFKFETDGSMTAQQALDIAVDTLSKEAKGFASDIAAL